MIPLTPRNAQLFSILVPIAGLVQCLAKWRTAATFTNFLLRVVLLEMLGVDTLWIYLRRCYVFGIACV